MGKWHKVSAGNWGYTSDSGLYAEIIRASSGKWGWEHRDVQVGCTYVYRTSAEAAAAFERYAAEEAQRLTGLDADGNLVDGELFLNHLTAWIGKMSDARLKDECLCYSGLLDRNDADEWLIDGETFESWFAVQWGRSRVSDWLIERKLDEKE